jgi:hypothetical protein
MLSDRRQKCGDKGAIVSNRWGTKRRCGRFGAWIGLERGEMREAADHGSWPETWVEVVRPGAASSFPLYKKSPDIRTSPLSLQSSGIVFVHD